jgi:hypothetical protein
MTAAMLEYKSSFSYMIQVPLLQLLQLLLLCATNAEVLGAARLLFHANN